MLEGSYIDKKLLYDFKESTIWHDIESLTKKLKFFHDQYKNHIEEILDIMNSLQLYKIALVAKISSSLNKHEDHSQYISARAAVTIKAKDSKLSKRIWVNHYLGDLNEYLLPSGKVDMAKVRHFGREPVVRKLVEKLMTESGQ
jgi:hypothetical protein